MGNVLSRPVLHKCVEERGEGAGGSWQSGRLGPSSVPMQSGLRRVDEATGPDPHTPAVTD
jgi:hypothetical protein